MKKNLYKVKTFIEYFHNITSGAIRTCKKGLILTEIFTKINSREKATKKKKDFQKPYLRQVKEDEEEYREAQHQQP